MTLAFVLIAGWTLTYGQNKQPVEAQEAAEVYRVMSLIEMFEGDEDAKEKLVQMMFKVTNGQKPQAVRIQRTDLEPQDYERALNRLAAEGWTLVTVNKSNYWVFKKKQ